MKRTYCISLILVLALWPLAQGARRDLKEVGLQALRSGRIPSTKPARDFTVLRPDANFVPDELFVRFAPGPDVNIPTRAQMARILGPLGATVRREFDLVPGLTIVKLPPGQSVDSRTLARFNRVPEILYAEPHYRGKVIEATMPNDRDFQNGNQWGLHNTGQLYGTPDADIDAPEAWDHATGNREIIVAVIDSGVTYDHPDLVNNVWINEAEFNGTPGVDDDDPCGYIDDIYGYDFCTYGQSRDSDPKAEYFHGTYCASIIGADTNDGLGIAGVCWHVRIMAVKWMDELGRGNNADVVAAISYAVAMGAHVTNNSYGWSDYQGAVKDAIDAAGEANVLFVASAGNNGANDDVVPNYPSSYNCDNLIAVMASDRNDGRWIGVGTSSNYGATTVDLAAPGKDIWGCSLGQGWLSTSGTSAAAPHVTGACALLWSINPSLTYQQIKSIIMDTVDVLPAFQNDPTLGRLCITGGRLNLHNAVNDPRVTDNSQAHVWATTLRSGQVVDTAWVDMWGNLMLDGTLTEQSPCNQTGFRGFKFRNDAGSSVVALLDADLGNMCLAGHVYELRSTLTPMNAHLVVKASDGTVLAYLDNSGNLYLKGQVYESMW